MDEKSKDLKKMWKQQERAAQVAALPLSASELRALFDSLDRELDQRACDHTRRIAHGWLAERGVDPDPVFARLQSRGGFCDCEILANVEPEIEGIIG